MLRSSETSLNILWCQDRHILDAHFRYCLKLSAQGADLAQSRFWKIPLTSSSLNRIEYQCQLFVSREGFTYWTVIPRSPNLVNKLIIEALRIKQIDSTDSCRILICNVQPISPSATYRTSKSNWYRSLGPIVEYSSLIWSSFGRYNGLLASRRLKPFEWFIISSHSSVLTVCDLMCLANCDWWAAWRFQGLWW